MADSLERLCGPAGQCRQGTVSWIREAPASAGLERMEAFFVGQAYAPHQHDTYAIGYTVSGIQCFDYRGETRRSLPGQVIVLHPDELHDGRAGNENGFQYRMIYIDPESISQALGGKPLPFVREVVQEHHRFRHTVDIAFDDIDHAMDDLRLGELILQIATHLSGTAAIKPQKNGALDAKAIARTRAYLCANLERSISRDELEHVSGLDRWTLARQFRRACGTSMSRYLTMRRLERARRLLTDGTSLAEAAAAVGFSDQSHMTRHFKKTYGLSPGHWVRLSTAMAHELRSAG